MKENIKHEKGNIKKLEGKVVTETKKITDAQTSMENATESIPTLQQRIEECTQHKVSEDIKLESIFEETKGITEQLRLELEEKTQELAPLQQERTVYQNSLDTAQMEVNLLEDTVSRALDQLENATKELASLDGKQSSMRVEFDELTMKLAGSKERVSVAEGELKELTRKEGELAKKSTELLVSWLFFWVVVATLGCTNISTSHNNSPLYTHIHHRLRLKSPGPRCNPPPVGHVLPTQSSRPRRRMASLPTVASWDG